MISRRTVLKWAAAVAATGVTTGAYAFGVEPMLWLRVTRYHVRPKAWPAGMKVTIAALADIHACDPWMTPERIRSIVTLTNELGADAIALLGDYGTAHKFVLGKVEPAAWARELGALRAPLGVHAILGNHDWWEDREVMRTRRGQPFGRRALEDAGIKVYENDVTRLTKDGQPLWIAGLGDQLAWFLLRRRAPGAPIGVDDLPGTLAKVTDDAPVILLAHEPDIIRQVPERVALTLSGHTHGGQVRLFGWSPVVPSGYGNKYAYGHIRERSDLIVSGGLGCSIMPVRFGVPPEIVLVTLGGEAATS
jgi:predicted MPP superfamily phosphohydrolase